jgi:hypothetical protein
MSDAIWAIVNINNSKSSTTIQPEIRIYSVYNGILFRIFWIPLTKMKKWWKISRHYRHLSYGCGRTTEPIEILKRPSHPECRYWSTVTIWGRSEKVSFFSREAYRYVCFQFWKHLFLFLESRIINFTWFTQILYEYNYTRVIYKRADFTTFYFYELRTFCANILVFWTMDDNEFTWTRQTPQITSGGGLTTSTNEIRMMGGCKFIKYMEEY